MNLKLFRTAFLFINDIRESLKTLCIRKNLRFNPHPLNGQIDIQPIRTPFYQMPPFAVSGQRKIYLNMAFETFGSIPKRIIILDVVLDLTSLKLTAHAVAVTNGRDKEDVLNLVTTVSLGTQKQLALELLDSMNL
jgi:hypothetical protein